MSTISGTVAAASFASTPLLGVSVPQVKTVAPIRPERTPEEAEKNLTGTGIRKIIVDEEK